MRTLPALAAALVIAATAATSGCGQQRAQAGPAGAGQPLGSAPAHAGCGSAVRVPPRNKILTVGNADNGKAFCVTRGTAVQVILRSAPERKWAPIHTSSTVLAPHANGRMMLVVGATGASYVAARPGTAVISSARPACAQGSQGNAPSPPGTMHCGAMLGYRVTVIVTR